MPELTRAQLLAERSQRLVESLYDAREHLPTEGDTDRAAERNQARATRDRLRAHIEKAHEAADEKLRQTLTPDRLAGGDIFYALRIFAKELRKLLDEEEYQS